MQPFIASVAVILSVDFTGPHILVVIVIKFRQIGLMKAKTKETRNIKQKSTGAPRINPAMIVASGIGLEDDMIVLWPSQDEYVDAINPRHLSKEEIGYFVVEILTG